MIIVVIFITFIFDGESGHCNNGIRSKNTLEEFLALKSCPFTLKGSTYVIVFSCSCRYTECLRVVRRTKLGDKSSGCLQDFDTLSVYMRDRRFTSIVLITFNQQLNTDIKINLFNEIRTEMIQKLDKNEIRIVWKTISPEKRIVSVVFYRISLIFFQCRILRATSNHSIFRATTAEFRSKQNSRIYFIQSTRRFMPERLAFHAVSDHGWANQDHAAELLLVTRG